MKLQQFSREDIPCFLKMAANEGWVAEAWEVAFLRDTFPGGCYCVRNDGGAAFAFVTAIKHDRSGWIGNLIVAPAYRGKGIGECLFTAALEALWSSGVETVWLTASAMGKRLYEKHGFRSVDRILRWCGAGRAGSDTTRGDGCLDAAVDALGWGDSRSQLLRVTVERGNVQAEFGDFLVTQPCGPAFQVGPFGAIDPVRAARLLAAALGRIPAGSVVWLDAPRGNNLAIQLFQQHGFVRRGTAELMCAGREPAYRPEYVYALASMGSMG